MHAVIQRVITNHNMWPIFSTNVSLRVQSYFRSFLLHGRLKAMRAMNIWTRSIGGYIQECTVLCVKALGLVIEIWISIRNFHWRKKQFENAVCKMFAIYFLRDNGLIKYILLSCNCGILMLVLWIPWEARAPGHSADGALGTGFIRNHIN